MTIDSQQIDFADQQLIGYNAASRGETVSSLIAAMGLRKEEWEYLKANDVSWLSDRLYEEIEDYFNEEQESC